MGSSTLGQAMTSPLRKAVIAACNTGFLSGLRRGSFIVPSSLMRIGQKLLRCIHSVQGVMREGKWRRDEEMRELRGVREGPAPRCSLEATMSCFRAHLEHPQAAFFGRAFTSVAIHHRAAGRSLVTFPPFPPLLSRHLHSRTAFLRGPPTTLFYRQL